MAKLPGVADLGGLPTPDRARPVATYDGGGPIARVGAAVAEAGRALGAGLAKLGEGAIDLADSKNRWDYAKANSTFLTDKVTLDANTLSDTNYGPDDSGKPLAQRYGEKLGELRDKAAGMIGFSPMRERFMDHTGQLVAEGQAQVQLHQRKLEDSANVAYVDEQGNATINQAVASPDDATRRQLIDTHNGLVDGLVASGSITPVQGVGMKQAWAKQYATADVLAAKNSNDPDRIQGALNRLRLPAGSAADITDRIINVEGDGKNSRSSSRGVGQFTDQTWLDIVKSKRPDLVEGKSDEEILDLRADRGLARQMVDANRSDNESYLRKQGVEATPGALYLAHILGPAGATAVLKADPNKPVVDVLGKAVGKDKAAAMIEANPTILNGQLAGSVKHWADGKVGGGHIYSVLDGDPVLREHLVAQLQEGLHTAHVDDLTNFKTRFQDTTTEAMNTGAATNPMSRTEFVTALGADAGPKAFKHYQGQLQLGTDIAKVATLDPDQQQKLLESYTPAPGSEGFAEQSKRQSELAKAIDRDQSMRAKDPEFKRAIETSIAEAGRTGQATSPIGKDEFVRRFGKEDGARNFASYSASLRLGRDVAHVGELSPKEQEDLLAGYEPNAGGADYIEASKRHDALEKAIGQISIERDKDPAAFAVRRLPVVQDAYAKFNAAAPDPTAPLDVKQAAAREFATKMDMEQARIGVPAEMRTLVPKEYIDQFNARLSKPAAAGGTINVAGMIENEARIWGDAWPQVYKQFSKGAAPVAMVIGSGVKPAAAQILTEFANTNLKDIANDQSEEKLGTIKKDVRDAFRPLSRSMAGNEGTQAAVDGFQASGEKLAAYYVRQGKTSSDAAAQAFDDLLGHKYDFSAGTYRVPKSLPFSSADIAAGVSAAKLKMADLNVAPARDTIGGVSPEYLKSATEKAYARDGQWVTAPDESGLALIYKDQAVRRNDGQSLVLSWQQLATMGKQHGDAVRGARGLGIAP